MSVVIYIIGGAMTLLLAVCAVCNFQIAGTEPFDKGGRAAGFAVPAFALAAMLMAAFTRWLAG